jgi:glycerol-3-phosphate O-acyltransferase
MFIQLLPPLVVLVVSLAALFTYPTIAVVTLTSLAIMTRWLRKASSIGLYRTVDALYVARTVLSSVRSQTALSPSEVESAIVALDRLIERLKSTGETWFLGNSAVVARYNAVLQAELYVQVLHSASVQEAMCKTGASEKDVLKMLRSLSGSQSSVVLTVLGISLRLVIRILFPLGIQLSDKSIARLKAASASGGPVLLLPCHKSHVDYMVLHLLMINLGLPVPLCIAGENLNMPLIGWILQKSGAVFIKRSFSCDSLYQAVFREHTLQLVKQGHMLECFIEGGRSRSGKLLPPKIGFLKSVVDPVIDGEIDDVTIVPISIAYDRIVEGPSHVAELSGGVKTPEKFWSAVHTTVSLLNLAFRRLVCFGRVDVSVAEPISVKEHLALKAVATTADCKARTQFALSLGFKNQHSINEVSAILPTMLVGTVLLFNGAARALPMEELVKQVSWLSVEIRERGGRVETAEHQIDRAVTLVVDRIMGMCGLGSSRSKLIKRHKAFLMTGLFTPLERMELATFRNSLIHVFIIEAILCASFVSGATPKVSVDRLKAAALFLSALLKLEFIFRPATLEENFNSALDMLVRKGVFAREADDVELINKNPHLWKFLIGLVAPYIDSYYVLALTVVDMLGDGKAATQSALVTDAQQRGEKMFFEEEIAAYEVVAKDTLQNAVSVFMEDGSLDIVPVVGGEKHVRLVNVDDFKLKKLIRINEFRQSNA